MAYSTNIYDLYKKVEENHQRLDEAQEDIFKKKVIPKRLQNK